MSITLKINNGSTTKTVEDVPYTSNMNAQQALEAAYNTVTIPPAFPLFSYWMDYFGTENDVYLGYLIQSMDGLTAFGSKYWMLYVNGALSNEGIDSTTLSDSDSVEFKYQQYSQQEHENTVWSQFHDLISRRT